MNKKVVVLLMFLLVLNPVLAETSEDNCSGFSWIKCLLFGNPYVSWGGLL